MEDKHILDSWKEISKYLGRSVSTCQRWERELGLPIRRLDGSPKASVFAYSKELDCWLEDILESGEISQKKRHAFSSIKAKFIAISFAIILIVSLGIVFWQPWSKGKRDSASPDKPSLAILYFKNNTGNEDLNYYREFLSDILTEDLSQSKFIYVLPKERIYSILSKMDLLEAQNYTSEQLARIADKAVVDHLILGTYAKVGDRFRITTTLHEARSSKLLAVEKIEDDENNIFPMVDSLTERLKPYLALSQRNIENDIDSSLSDISTTSVEAYRHHNEAQRHIKRSDWALAVPFLERAVAVDPGFGMAFRSLYMAYTQMGDPEKAREAMLKAYELRARVSERERLHILAAYHNLNQDRTQAIDAYEKLLEIYPEDPTANNNLGLFYSFQEEFEKAIERYRIPINKKAESVFLYDGLAFAFCGLGEYGKALEVLDRYRKDILDNWYIRLRFSQIYLIEGKYELALREADKSLEMNPMHLNIKHKGKIFQTMGNLEQAEIIFQNLTESGDRLDRLFGLRSLAEQYYQQRRFPETQEQLELGIELAEELGLKDFKTFFCIRLGFLFLSWGKPQRTLEECTNAGRTYMSSHLRGLAYLNLNQVELAQEEASILSSLLEKENNKNLIRHHYHLLGMIEHKQDNISKALEYFEAAVALLPFQRPYPKIEHPLFLEPLAEAYYATGDWDNALSVYERITVLTEERLNFSNIYVKAFYNLGKIYEQQGDTAKAIENYKKFLTLWKDADPGLAEVKEAKKNLADLRSP